MHWTTYDSTNPATLPPTYTVFLIERASGTCSLGWWDDKDNLHTLQDGDKWMVWPADHISHPVKMVSDRERKLETAVQAFLDGWKQFCSKINFGASPLNGEAIRFMNEVPGKLRAALK